MNKFQPLTDDQSILPSDSMNVDASSWVVSTTSQQSTVYFPRKTRRSIFVNLPAEPDVAQF